MTTQVVFLPSSLVRDYAITGELKADGFIQDALTKEIGLHVKRILLDEFNSQIEVFFDDIEKAQQDALVAYLSLQKMMKSVYEDKGTISEIQNYYSPILSSNFRFALRNLAGLLQMLLIGIQQAELPKKKLPKKTIRKLKKDMERIVSSTGSDMPDATKISNDDEIYESLLAGTTLGFNVAIFMTLVIMVAAIIQSRTSLTKIQLEQMEELLRDWTQETIAQLTVIIGQNQSESTLPDFEGIIADDEDAIIVEEGLHAFDSELE
jgi:hypothetical protein